MVLVRLSGAVGARSQAPMGLYTWRCRCARWWTAWALLVAVSPAGALEASLELATWSRYVFRGQTYSDGAVLQPALTVSSGPWNWTTWANLDLSDANSTVDREVQWRFTEVDIYLNWASPTWGPCSVGFGLGTYAIAEPPGASGDSTEVSAWYRFDPSALDSVPRWIREWPAVTWSVYYEFLEYEDWYASVELGRTLPLAESWELTGYARVGYAGRKYNQYFFATSENATAVDQTGWNDLTVRAEIAYTLAKTWKVGVLAEYGRFLDEDLRDAAREIYGRGDWRAVGLKFRHNF